MLPLVLVCFTSWACWVIYLSISSQNLNTRFAPDGSLEGTIAVTIIERKTGPQKHLTFVIDPKRGEILPSNAQFNGPLGPGGRIDRCGAARDIPAPNGEMVATCLSADDGREAVQVLKSGSRERIRLWPGEKNWDVCGIAWSPDSTAISGLFETERLDVSPIGLLAALSGHPIPLVTFKVDVFAIDSDRQLQLPAIRKNSPSGWARVDWAR